MFCARPTLLAAVLAAAAGCADDPLGLVFPKIAVEPEALDFGAGFVGRDNAGMLTARNVGQAALLIEGYAIDPANGVFQVVSGPDALAPNAEGAIVLAFAPARAKETYQADLVIRSNDPDRPELRVPLRGTGGVREIEVVPTDIDFGIVNEGSRAVRQVEIRNVGKDVLSIQRLTWTSTSIDLGPDPGTFSAATLAAGTSTNVTLVYSPVDLGGDHGELVIFSDDEDEAEVTVRARGYANLAPRAIAFGCAPAVGRVACDGAPDRGRIFNLGLRQRVALDGRDSADPEGAPIAGYRWVVEARPTGSSAAVFHSTDDRNLRRRATGDIEVDVVGTYEIRLIVTDDRGLDSFDLPESRVTIRPKDLEVLLRWDVATDVDLHLVRPSGSLGDYGNGQIGTSTGSDASSFNRQPNWGDPATALDNPSLDIDDVSGRGPEIVSLDRPEDGGVYSAWAHYCDSRDIGVAANVTIEVFVRGQRVATIPDSGTGFALVPGEAWLGAEITWHQNGGAPTVDVREGTVNLPVMQPGLCRQM